MKYRNTMNKYANDIIPNHLTHPGEVLKDELGAREMTQNGLAREANMTKSQVSQIISGERNITPAIAVKIEHALGIDAEFWVNMQNRYDRLKSLSKIPELRKEISFA